MCTLALYLLSTLATTDWGSSILSCVFALLDILLIGFLDPLLIIFISILAVIAILYDTVIITGICCGCFFLLAQAVYSKAPAVANALFLLGILSGIIVSSVFIYHFYYQSPEPSCLDRHWRNDVREFVLGTKTIDGNDLGVSSIMADVLNYAIKFPEDCEKKEINYLYYNLMCVKFCENWFIKERFSYFPTAEQSWFPRIFRFITLVWSFCTDWYSIPVTFLVWYLVWMPVSWILINISPGIYILIATFVMAGAMAEEMERSKK